MYTRKGILQNSQRVQELCVPCSFIHFVRKSVGFPHSESKPVNSMSSIEANCISAEFEFNGSRLFKHGRN